MCRRPARPDRAQRRERADIVVAEIASKYSARPSMMLPLRAPAETLQVQRLAVGNHAIEVETMAWSARLTPRVP